MRAGSNGPLKDVQEVEFLKPIPVSALKALIPRPPSERGPKSDDKWRHEIRKIWACMDDVDKLGKSWIAALPTVRKLAISKYGGGLDGRGRVLKELFTKALEQAKLTDADDMTRALLNRYPKETLKDIAAGFNKSREQFSRTIGTKAAVMLVTEFRRVTGRPVRVKPLGNQTTSFR